MRKQLTGCPWSFRKACVDLAPARNALVVLTLPNSRMVSPRSKRTACDLVVDLDVDLATLASSIEHQNQTSTSDFSDLSCGGTWFSNASRTHWCISSSEMAEIRSAAYSASILSLIQVTRGSCLGISIS